MEKKKKTPTSSKRGRGRPATGHTIKLRPEYKGTDAYKIIEPPGKPDIEETLPSPEDAGSKHAYPPPKKNPVFRAKWMRFIENIMHRENFNVAHLDSLEVLCDLYVEYDLLQAFIRKKGRSYLSLGRHGETWKFYPEVARLSAVQNQIKEFTKMLGLLLKKDEGKQGSGGEEEEWA